MAIFKKTTITPDELDRAKAMVVTTEAAHLVAARAAKGKPTPENIEAAQKTRAALNAAREALADAEALDRDDLQRGEALAAEARKKDLMASCARVLELQQRCQGEAREVTQLADQLVPALTKLSDTRAELHKALEPLIPAGQGQIVREAGLLQTGYLAAILRVHLAGQGWTWIASPVLHGSKTSFAQRIEDADAYIRTILPTPAE